MEVWLIEGWRNAEIVPIPKKGDLKMCDNWHSISLMNAVRKLFGRIIQDWLKSLAEAILPDSQYVFRSGWGCIDMIFVEHELEEKTY